MDPEVEKGVTFSASLVGEVAGEAASAGAGRFGDDEVVLILDQLAGPEG
jgi:hypothetical protein